jgi:sodium/hydrogen exchanger-like protein 6/7
LEGLDISFVEAMSVGATLSATDPVTILAIFNTYKVDPKLYTIIFGESILNDAIAIVLFETAQKYKPGAEAGKLTILSLFESIGVFMLVFFGSLAIGIVVGVATSLLLKFTHVRRDPKIESCLIFLIAYASYFFANAIHMSGRFHNKRQHPLTIVLILFHRNRVTFVLRYLPQALCVSQYVETNTAHNQVCVLSDVSAL